MTFLHIFFFSISFGDCAVSCGWRHQTTTNTTHNTFNIITNHHAPSYQLEPKSDTTYCKQSNEYLEECLLQLANRRRLSIETAWRILEAVGENARVKPRHWKRVGKSGESKTMWSTNLMELGSSPIINVNHWIRRFSTVWNGKRAMNLNVRRKFRIWRNAWPQKKEFWQHLQRETKYGQTTRAPKSRIKR